MKEILSFSIPCPKYKNQVISLNNINKWYRYQGSTIKNNYKNSLKEWLIPESNLKLEDCFVEFQLFRHNNRIFDADALGFIVKWTIDAIKEQGYFKDDNTVSYMVHAAKLDKNLTETMIKVSVMKN